MFKQKRNAQMTDVNPTILINTLNATNIPIKKQRLSDGIEKARLGKHTSNII